MKELNEKFKIRFLGNCMGVGINPRGINDDALMVTLLTEDDENWFSSNQTFNSYWLDEMITQLQAAKAYIEFQKDKPNGYDKP